MMYTYDGKRSLIEYYTKKISILEKQIEDLEEKNRLAMKLLVQLAGNNPEKLEPLTKTKK